MPLEITGETPKEAEKDSTARLQEAVNTLSEKPAGGNIADQLSKKQAARLVIASELEKFANYGFALTDKNRDDYISFDEVKAAKANPPGGAKSETIDFILREFSALKLVSDDQLLWETEVHRKDLRGYRAEAKRIFSEAIAENAVRALKNTDIASLQALLGKQNFDPALTTRKANSALANGNSDHKPTISYKTENTAGKETGYYTITAGDYQLKISTDPLVRPTAAHYERTGIFSKEWKTADPATALKQISRDARQKDFYYMDPLPWITQ